MWLRSYSKSIICDVDELEKARKEFTQTDEGALLAGTEKEEEIDLFTIAEYIKQWCEGVIAGLPKNIGELHELLSNHAEEVYAFVKVRGAAVKILDYLQQTWTANFCTTWNLHMVKTAKSVATLKNKEGKTKGMATAIINTSGGASFLEILGDQMFATNRLHQMTQCKVVCHTASCPSDMEGKDETPRKPNPCRKEDYW